MILARSMLKPVQCEQPIEQMLCSISLCGPGGVKVILLMQDEPSGKDYWIVKNSW